MLSESMFPLTSGRTLTKRGTESPLRYLVLHYWCFTNVPSKSLARAGSHILPLLSRLNADGGVKGQVRKCDVVTQPFACHTTWTVLGAEWGATVLPAPPLPQKIYPRATTEPWALEQEHCVPLYFFYLNELLQWSQLWVLKTAKVIFVLLPSENMWLKCNLFTART